MSPALARTSNDAILAAARDLLEAGGLDAVTMQAVADRVGVRAPSLYKRLAGRGALLTALADDVARDLARFAAPALAEADPEQAVRVLAARYRAFAHRSPEAYRVLFTNALPEANPSPQANAEASAGLLQVTRRLVGPERALEAARLLVAFAHGFVSMELAGAFRLGGDVDAAFDFSVEAIIRGLRATAEAQDDHPGPSSLQRVAV